LEISVVEFGVGDGINVNFCRVSLLVSNSAPKRITTPTGQYLWKNVSLGFFVVGTRLKYHYNKHYYNLLCAGFLAAIEIDSIV